MDLVDSFLLATAVSYFAATVIPIRFEKKMSLILQKVIYLLCGLALLLSVTYLNTSIILLRTLGILYSTLAILCFGGAQDWGSPNNNIVMAVWDLSIAICCFTKLTL